MTKLSVIILNYNTREYLERCLLSIKDQVFDSSKIQLEIIVVDNASTDGSSKLVKNKFPWVKLIKNQDNLGFARANNLAMRGAEGEIILLLNSDTVIRNGLFEKMIEFMKDEKIGAATARLELPDGALDLACHRGFPTPWNALTYFLGLERLFPNSKIFAGYHQTWKNFETAHEVDAISGACFFIKKKVIDEVGLFDERFFIYAEDLDWCMRIKNKGWKIYYNPDVEVIHYKKRSGRKKEKKRNNIKEVKDIRFKSTYHFYETMKLFYDKHYQDRYPKWLRNMVLVGIWLITKTRLLISKIS